MSISLGPQTHPRFQSTLYWSLSYPTSLKIVSSLQAAQAAQLCTLSLLGPLAATRPY